MLVKYATMPSFIFVPADINLIICIKDDDFDNANDGYTKKRGND